MFTWHVDLINVFKQNTKVSSWQHCQLRTAANKAGLCISINLNVNTRTQRCQHDYSKLFSSQTFFMANKSF